MIVYCVGVGANASLSGRYDPDRRLVLSDSGALFWLNRENCGPMTSRPERLHRIDAGSMMTFKLRPI